MKRNKRFDDLLAKVPEETKRRVEKQMSCKWLRYGDECGKGLPGTPCEDDDADGDEIGFRVDGVAEAADCAQHIGAKTEKVSEFHIL